MFLVTLVVRARANKVVMADGGMVNRIGQARTALDACGKVFVHGEYWDAVSTLRWNPVAKCGWFPWMA